jgi:hypothetical protein
VLDEIRAVELFPMKLASFFDCLIDYAAALSLELSQRPPDRSADSLGDYQRCLRLLRAAPGNLRESVSDLVRYNERLQMRHNQDRVMLIRQNELIASLRGEPPPDPEEDEKEAEKASDRLAQLRHQFDGIARQLKELQRRVPQPRRRRE